MVGEYQDITVARNQNLKNFSKILGRLMDKGSVTTGTQTNPADLSKSAMHSHRSSLNVSVAASPLARESK